MSCFCKMMVISTLQPASFTEEDPPSRRVLSGFGGIGMDRARIVLGDFSEQKKRGIFERGCFRWVFWWVFGVSVGRFPSQTMVHAGGRPLRNSTKWERPPDLQDRHVRSAGQSRYLGRGIRWYHLGWWKAIRAEDSRGFKVRQALRKRGKVGKGGKERLLEDPELQTRISHFLLVVSRWKT